MMPEISLVAAWITMHDHAHTIVTTGNSLYPVMAAMFLTGLAGGFGHCTTMCGPFVMAQVAGGIAGRGPVEAAPPPMLSRLRGGLLLPYHAGRLTTYAALGGAVGGLSGLVVRATEYRWLLAAFMLLAALLFLGQGLKGLSAWMPALLRLTGRAGGGWAQALGLRLSRPLRPLFARPGGINGYLLGLVLGFLPCGFLYAALASAVGVGSAAGGFLVMAAFAAGTVPALVAVGVLGSAAGFRWGGVMRAVAPALMLFNAGVLGLMAWHAVSA